MTARVLAVAAAALLAGCGGGPEQDRGQIAFARAPATNAFSDLYLLQTDGTLQRLTHDGIDSMPAWSPDGLRLAFQRVHRGQPTSLLVANADGSGQRQLPESVSGPVDWSPDGDRILLSDGGKLYVASSDRGSRTILLDPTPARAEDPSWSPDGRQVAFALGTDARGADVYVMNADGTGRKRLTRLGRDAGWPSPLWSPDGRRIAYLLPGSLNVMNADGSGKRVLARFPDGVLPSSPTWSPDGSAIAFTRLKLGRDRHASGIYLVQADGSALHRLTRNIDSNPSWSPDGRRLAFQRLTGFHVSEIVLMDRDGSNEVSLTGGGWTDSTPSWRPSVD